MLDNESSPFYNGSVKQGKLNTKMDGLNAHTATNIRASFTPQQNMKTSIITILTSAFVCTSNLIASAEATNSESITERNQQLYGEIVRWESRCVPTNGTSRADLEIKFGTGRAEFNGMAPPPGGIPADSPYRAYDFCTNGTLFVCYDKTWHVELAQYIDPYAIQNPISIIQPEEVTRELEQRLKQMKQIAEVYKKRFGGDSYP